MAREEGVGVGIDARDLGLGARADQVRLILPAVAIEVGWIAQTVAIDVPPHVRRINRPAVVQLGGPILDRRDQPGAGQRQFGGQLGAAARRAVDAIGTHACDPGAQSLGLQPAAWCQAVVRIVGVAVADDVQTHGSGISAMARCPVPPPSASSNKPTTR